jgi:hypothetical protein
VCQSWGVRDTSGGRPGETSGELTILTLVRCPGCETRPREPSLNGLQAQSRGGSDVSSTSTASGFPRLVGLEPGYSVRPGAYPEQPRERVVVAVDDEGRVVGAIWFIGHGARWYPSSMETCDFSAIF